MKRSRQSPRLVGVEGIAEELHLTSRHVQRLVQVGMPRNSRGKYDLYRCVLWYALHVQESMRRREFSQNKEAQRLTKVKADLGELELAEKRGQLIPVSIYRELVTTLCTSIRQRFLILPSRIAPQLEGENRITIKAKLDQAVRGTLMALSVAETERGDRDTQSRSPARAGGRPPAQRKPARTSTGSSSAD